MSKLPGQRVAILIDGQNIYPAKAGGAKLNYSKIMNALNGRQVVRARGSVKIFV